MITFLGWIFLSIIVGVLGQNKNIGFGWAFFLALIFSPLIGLIIVLVSDSKTIRRRPKYIDHRELGEKAEFKGQFKEAVNHYMDSLYHLKNDYKNIKLSKQLEAKRQLQIVEISRKVKNIKSENPELFSNIMNPQLDTDD